MQLNATVIDSSIYHDIFSTAAMRAVWQIRRASSAIQLTVGFLSSLARMALLVVMLVAILTSGLSAMPKGLSPLNWLDDFLYLPEVLYVLFFIWLICSGPGKFSVDYWLAGKLTTCCSTKA